LLWEAASVKQTGVALLPYGAFHGAAKLRDRATRWLRLRNLMLGHIAQCSLIADGFKSSERWKFAHVLKHPS
jgi:hypothetical protein